MLCAIYIRKSREDATKAAHRLTAQRSDLPAFAKQQGWQVEIYDDGHASAARGKTEALVERTRLEQDIVQGKVSVVLCIELSRLSRDDSLQDYVAWLHLCAEHNVRLATPARTLDPAQPSDWMLLLLEGGFSSVEMKVLQRRMAEGRLQAIREGKWISGNPTAPYVFKNGALVIDEDKLPQVEQLLELAETHSTQAAHELTGVPINTIRAMKSDRRLLFYQGMRRDPVNGKIIQGQWPAIIDATRAERIRQARSQRTKRAGAERRHAAGLLSNLDGLLVCPYCGKGVRSWKNSKPRKDGTRIDYYGCAYKDRPKHCPQSRMVPQMVIDEKVVTNLASSIKRLEKLGDRWQQNAAGADSIDLDDLDARETELKEKKKRLVAAIADGLISFADARPKTEGIDQELKEIASTRTAAEPVQIPRYEEINITREEFENLDTQDKRALLRSVIKQIRVYEKHLIIEYKFPLDTNGRTTSRVHLPPPGRRNTRKKYISKLSNISHLQSRKKTQCTDKNKKTPQS